MSKEPVTHAEVRQLLMSDITHDDDCDTMHRYVNEQEAEIARLKGELRIKTAYVDRAPFCGDCRDKVAGLPCLRCENQRLKAELAEARNDHVHLRGTVGDLKAKLAEAVKERDVARAGMVELACGIREANADADLLGQVIFTLPDHACESALGMLKDRPTAAARVKGGA